MLYPGEIRPCWDDAGRRYSWQRGFLSASARSNGGRHCPDGDEYSPGYDNEQGCLRRVGILAGSPAESFYETLLLPVLSMAKARAHSTTCKNRIRQMGQALQMYCG